MSWPQHRVGRVVEREDRGARHQVDERLPRRLEAMMFASAELAHCPPPIEPVHVERHGHEQMRRARGSASRSPCAGVGVSSATTQTSPMLLRLPLRFGFGPSTFGVNSPLLIERADELQVVVAERRGVLLERPLHVDEPEVQVVGGVGLAVGAVVRCPPPRTAGTASGRRRRRRAPCPACGSTLMPSILS